MPSGVLLWVHLTILANIASQWDCLGMGIAAHTPFKLRNVMTCTSVVILPSTSPSRSASLRTIIDATHALRPVL
jgi:hypothetical protein